MYDNSRVVAVVGMEYGSEGKTGYWDVRRMISQLDKNCIVLHEKRLHFTVYRGFLFIRFALLSDLKSFLLQFK
jgi:hypothetical protein